MDEDKEMILVDQWTQGTCCGSITTKMGSTGIIMPCRSIKNIDTIYVPLQIVAESPAI